MSRLLAASLAFTLAAAPVRDALAQSAAEQYIRDMNARLERWYNSGQVDSAAEVYAKDARVFGPNAPPAVGQDSIAAYWRRGLAGARWQFTLNTQQVIQDGGIAVEHGRYTLVITPTGTTAPVATDRGNYIVVWVQQGEHWVIKYDIAASEQPLPSQH